MIRTMRKRPGEARRRWTVRREAADYDPGSPQEQALEPGIRRIEARCWRSWLRQGGLLTVWSVSSEKNFNISRSLKRLIHEPTKDHVASIIAVSSAR